MPALQDPLIPATPSHPQNGLYTLWGALIQAFTVEDVFQRKIK